jgi:hypothetical protein
MVQSYYDSCGCAFFLNLFYLTPHYSKWFGIFQL